MASGTLAKVMPEVFAHEGGYGNDPRDPGGATNFGITAAVLGSWRKLGRIATPAEVKAMPKSEALNIYRANYWNLVRGDDLPAGVDYAVLDFGINSGVVRAAKALQKAAGVAQDGHIGPLTLAAVRARDPAKLVKDISAGRLAYLQSLTKLSPTFGKGWTRRVNEVRATALKLI